MTQSQMLDKIKTLLEDNIPAVLTVASLDDFDDYLDEPPSDMEKKQLAVYLAEGSNKTDSGGESFLIQAQLPKIFRPDKYLSAMWGKIKEILDPSLLGFTSKEMSHITWYPSETNGAASFIYIEISFNTMYDDCDD